MTRVIEYEMSKNIDTQSLSDAQILALSVKQPHYFEVIVERYQRQFVRKAISVLRNEEDASDVVQETFVRIYTAANRFKKKEGATFSSWAYAILVNQCYTAYRKQRRSSQVSIESNPAFADLIPDKAGIQEYEQRFVKDHVLSLISRLPVILRNVVDLYFIKGIPQQVIAEQEGVSNGVIRARIHRAKKELKKLDLQLVEAEDRSLTHQS